MTPDTQKPWNGETIHWNGQTCFLAWSLQSTEEGPAFVSRVHLLELVVVVCRDSSRQTWGVSLNNHLVVDGLSSAGIAQLHAVVCALSRMVELAGDPQIDAVTPKQCAARALLQVIHFALRDDFDGLAATELVRDNQVRAKNAAKKQGGDA